MLFNPQSTAAVEPILSEHNIDKSSMRMLSLTYEQKNKRNLDACFGSFVENQTIKYFTDGAWSMHQLLQYLLEQVGPAVVHLSTWTLTEGPARILLNLKDAGLITELHCLFDYRIEGRTPKTFHLVRSIADSIKLTKCHAKVATMVNDRKGVSIVGSANFSKNNRLEAGTVFTSRESALFDEKWISDKINGVD